jgi:hypothetical protein
VSKESSAPVIKRESPFGTPLSRARLFRNFGRMEGLAEGVEEQLRAEGQTEAAERMKLALSAITDSRDAIK